jgi:orotidine-5'-phosphate decarboxylase
MPGASRPLVQSFRERLSASALRANSWLCVGLDPDPTKFPAELNPEENREWCLAVVAEVADVTCAVKPNVAFFEALGDIGHEALVDLIARMPPELPVILDAKRNDIGHSAAKYAEAAFEELGADAITVTPYLGRDTVEPFASYEERGVFLLARTSNPSAGDFQDLQVAASGAGPAEPLYLHVARKAMEWDREWGNLGLVAGATYPAELAKLRSVCGDGVPFLIPGVGAQGGDALAAVRHGGDSQGKNALVNVGRSIVYAGRGDDWRAQVRQAATEQARALRA